MWVTQMNHIVMEIDQEPYRDWFSSQVRVARAGHRGPAEPGPEVHVLGSWERGCPVGPAPSCTFLGLPVSFRWEEQGWARESGGELLEGPVGNLGRAVRPLGKAGPRGKETGPSVLWLLATHPPSP